MINTKPPECTGCPLETTGTGFAPATGPREAGVCFIGEALGRQEAIEGTPFVGQAGAILNRAFGLLSIDRNTVRIGNTISCQPPKDWLVGAPWEVGAINHCARHRIQLSGHKVYVLLGVTPTRTVLEQRGMPYSGRIENWQSYVIGNGPYFIPTYHPAFIMRGNHKLMGAFLHALQRAQEVSTQGYEEQTADLVVDPDPIWFDEWTRTTLEAESLWMAVDIETPTKSDDEGELIPWTASQIIRINFAVNPDQGITVPWDPRYMRSIEKLLASPFAKLFWNERFDVPLLKKNEKVINGPIIDGMWAWHFLQSDLPRGLGFVAPFYSRLPPWKHLNATDPGPYAALDAVQTHRCVTGITSNLMDQDQWDTFQRHVVKFDTDVLHPAEQVGLRLDPTRLREFHGILAKRQDSLFDDIQKMVPDKLKPLSGGWKRPPGNKHPNAFPMTVSDVTKVCMDCGEADVTMYHKCKGATNGA